MKKEWIFLFVVLVIHYFNGIIYVEHEGFVFSETSPIVNFFYVLYQALLFLFISYVLIPKFLKDEKNDNRHNGTGF